MNNGNFLQESLMGTTAFKIKMQMEDFVTAVSLLQHTVISYDQSINWWYPRINLPLQGKYCN